MKSVDNVEVILFFLQQYYYANCDLEIGQSSKQNFKNKLSKLNVYNML